MNFLKICGYLISIFVVVSVLMYFFNQSQKASQLKREGDNFYNSKSYNGALKSYQEAERSWVLYRTDRNFQDRLVDTKEKIKNSPDLIITFASGTKLEEIKSLMNDIKLVNGVTDIKLIPKEDVYNTFIKENENNPKLIELVNPNLMSEKVELYVEDQFIEKVVQKLSSYKFIEDITFTKEN